jgi:hypothetical protein
MKLKHVFLFLAVAGLAIGCSSSQSTDQSNASSGSDMAEDAPPATPMATVPAGTPLLVSLQGDLSSETASDGMPFSAALVEPIMVNGRAVLPAGAQVHGTVAEVHDADDEEPVQMTLAVHRVETAVGMETEVEASPIILKDSGSVEGDVEKVAAGAVAGGVIGAVLGGGKGAAIGAGVGAGAGTIVAVVTKDDTIRLASGQKMQFTLVESASVPMPRAS